MEIRALSCVNPWLLIYHHRHQLPMHILRETAGSSRRRTFLLQPPLERLQPPSVNLVIIMVTQHIPTMTKSHHGGNMSVMIKGMCQCQNPTIHDKFQLGPVGSGKLFKSAPVLRRNISAHFVNLTEPSNAYWK